jgi:hypothetical protein
MTEVKVDASLFQCGHLERLPLGTSYPAVVAHVGRLLTKLPAGIELVIDFTGVGRPVFDMFLNSGISPTGLLITGGAVETRDGAIVGVPKLTLISRLQALLHQGRLKIQRDLAEAAALVAELQDYRINFTAAGALTFNARQGKHDDLVLALAIAAWQAYGGGLGMNMFEFYRREAAKLADGDEPERMVVGVDLGQAHDPTAIAVVRRVPAWRTEARPDPPPAPPPWRPEPVYAKGSVEHSAQAAARRAAATPTEDEKWLP